MLWKYIFNLLIGFDQFVNVVLLGDPDESISTRTSRALRSGKPKWFVPPFARFVDWLFLPFEKNHIENSFEENEYGERELWSWIKE